MKTVSLKDLKYKLSFWANQAAQGTAVQVTRYNRPYVYLLGDESSGVHYGKKVGREELTPALNRATRGRWLSILSQDRDE